MNDREQAMLLMAQGIVVGKDGEQIGKVGQVFVDLDTGRPTWVTVRTGWFGTRESFVPLDRATLQAEQILVPYDRDMIHGAPHEEVGGNLSVEDEDALHAYYGIADGQASDATSQAAGRLDSSDMVGQVPDADRGDRGQEAVVIRSEEHLSVEVQRVATRRARLHKFVLTEPRTVVVEVRSQQVQLVREPISDDNRTAVLAGADAECAAYELILTEDRIVVRRETVPVERITMDVHTVRETQQVTADVQSERVEVSTAGTGSGDRPVAVPGGDDTVAGTADLTART